MLGYPCPTPTVWENQHRRSYQIAIKRHPVLQPRALIKNHNIMRDVIIKGSHIWTIFNVHWNFTGHFTSIHRWLPQPGLIELVTFKSAPLPHYGRQPQAYISAITILLKAILSPLPPPPCGNSTLTIWPPNCFIRKIRGCSEEKMVSWHKYT